MSVGFCAEKFNIVSNDHGLVQKCDFSVLDQIYPFWVNLIQNQNCKFKLKVGIQTSLNMQNSMMFTFSVFDHKYPFWATLVPKFKIAYLK